jgi:hypothetical protein
MLESLRTSNDEFRTLTSQMKELSKPRSYALTTSRAPLSKDMRMFKLIQKASQNLHDVLDVLVQCTWNIRHTFVWRLSTAFLVVNRLRRLSSAWL